MIGSLSFHRAGQSIFYICGLSHPSLATRRGGIKIKGERKKDLRNISRTGEIHRRRGTATTTAATCAGGRQIEREERAGELGGQVALVLAAHLGQAHGRALGLPLGPEHVEPGVVEVEEGVTGAGDGVGHLGADGAVAGRVGGALDAGPEVEPAGHGEAAVGIHGEGGEGDEVDDGPVDAMVVDEVARPERVGVVGEGPVLDAPRGAHAVAAEAVDGVQENRGGEGAGVQRLVPVRLGAPVAALPLQRFLVRPHEETVVREELALRKYVSISE